MRIKLLSSILIAVVLVSAILLSGCGGPGSTPAATTAAPTTTAAPKTTQPTTSAPAPTTTAAPATTAASKDAIIVKAVSFTPIQSATVTGFRTLLDEINAATKGEVVVKYIGGPEAVPASGQFDALKNNVVDMINVPESYYAAGITGVGYVHLTQITPMEARTNGYFKLRNEMLQKSGVYYLGLTQYGEAFNIWLKKSIKTPKELAGLRLRSSPYYVPFLKAMNAAPVVMDPPEIYTSLDRGTIDGFVWAKLGVADYGWPAVAPYMVKTDFYSSGIENLWNLNTWNKIPKPMQETITNVMIKHEETVRVTMDEMFKKEVAAQQAKGAKYIEFSAEDAKYFTDLAYSTAWEDVLKNIKPTELGPQIKALISKK